MGGGGGGGGGVGTAAQESPASDTPPEITGLSPGKADSVRPESAAVSSTAALM